MTGPHPFHPDDLGAACIDCFGFEDDPNHVGRRDLRVVRDERDEPVQPADRLEIDAGIGDLREASTLAQSALQMANEPPRYFSHGGGLARIEVDDEGAPFTRPMSPDRLRHHLARAAWYYRKGPKGEPVEARPPMDVVRDLLASPDRMWPTLRRIIGVPVFASDGTLCATTGYNPSAQAWFHPDGLAVPSVPTDPDELEVAAAADLLLEVVRDFPFAEEADRAHAIALMLQPFARELIDGPTPMYLIEKPTPGTGATLLATAALWPALGREAATFTEAGNEEEWRKRITSTLRGAPEAILVENLHAKVNSASLAAVLTLRDWGDRLLGVSEMLRLPVRCAWVATANNPELSTEMVRRSIRIRMDTGLEEPWTRDPASFSHPDLRGWLREERATLVGACLTIVRAWVRKGSPPGTQSLGMYESWAKVVGGLLGVVGMEEHFLANMTSFYEAMITEDEGFAALVEEWAAKFGERVVGAALLFDLALAAGVDLGTGSERSQQTVFGNFLRRHRDRRFGDWFIRRAGTRSSVAQWRLQAR